MRCFENEDVVHVDGKVDPISDVETINTELILADLETVEKSITRVEKLTRSGNKDAISQLALFTSLRDHLGEGVPARTFSADEDQEKVLQQLHLITRKPIMYIANVDEESLTNSGLADRLEEYSNLENATFVKVCAQIEAEIAQLEDSERDEFLHDLGLQEPGLNLVIRAGYDLLNLQTFFTSGPKETRAWTVLKGATAPQAAGRIHTDFEKGFIRAELVAFDDYIAGNGEQGAKDAGKWRLEGKDYIMQEGDVVHFRFNV